MRAWTRPDVETDEVTPVDFGLRRLGDGRLDVHAGLPDADAYLPLTTLGRRRLRAEQRGVNDPWWLIECLEGDGFGDGPVHPSLESGEFVEFDLRRPDSPARADDASLGQACEIGAVGRERGTNTAGVVVGAITNRHSTRPDPLRRVLVVNDPLVGMGALSEPECRRIIGAIDLADREGSPSIGSR